MAKRLGGAAGSMNTAGAKARPRILQTLPVLEDFSNR